MPARASPSPTSTSASDSANSGSATGGTSPTRRRRARRRRSRRPEPCSSQLPMRRSRSRPPPRGGVALAAAASLATRFDSAIGAVICCDWNKAWHRPMVVDTMMNLELLLWGAENGGKPAWRDMALSHASKTLADMVRADGSTYHVVDYSTAGAILFRGTLQGYSDSSTWTRGQAWAIYGYTMVYRYTSDATMLAAAREVADYYLSRLAGESVPNWDLDAPTQHKDSSAAAAVASAPIELSGFVDI